MFVKPYPIRFRDTPAYYATRPVVRVNVISDDEPPRVRTFLKVPLRLIRDIHEIPKLAPGRIFKSDWEVA